MTTYYFPSDYGAAEYPAQNGSAGTPDFEGNFQQGPAGSYIVVTPNTVPPGSAQTYNVTFDYTGPGTGTTETLTQTNYSNSDYNETTDGTLDYLLANQEILYNESYTFQGASTPFEPSPAIATSDPTVCFAGGTLIQTTRGNVAVEDLVVGDIAITPYGDRRTICWLGHRVIETPKHEQQPVRIVAGAFGQSVDGLPVPTRDLCLSPGHPVLVGADADNEGGHLVPIMCLINGTTIKRVPVKSVTYWHVELDEHDILLAEGLAAESYIDLGSRPWFAGADSALYKPDMASPEMPGRCRPVAIDGAAVEAERRRLDGVFATQLMAACAWPDAAGAQLAM